MHWRLAKGLTSGLGELVRKGVGGVSLSSKLFASGSDGAPAPGPRSVSPQYWGQRDETRSPAPSPLACTSLYERAYGRPALAPPAPMLPSPVLTPLAALVQPAAAARSRGEGGPGGPGPGVRTAAGAGAGFSRSAQVVGLAAAAARGAASWPLPRRACWGSPSQVGSAPRAANPERARSAPGTDCTPWL